MVGGYEAVIVGAGHNGLTCACYLAKAGLKVLVLEQYSDIGDMTISEEIAAPGFLSDIHASGYLVGKLNPGPQELDLAAHGLELITPDPNWAQVYPDGRALAIGRDVETTIKGFAQFSAKDGETWRALYDKYLAAKPAITAGMNSAPPSLAQEFVGPAAIDDYRFQSQSARSWADENFESPEIRNFFACCALHACLAPDDALGGQFAWLFAAAVQDVGVSVVRGGMHHVSRALASVLQSHGGEIRTDASVSEIECENGRAKAVRLASGERIAVEGVVASNVDPKHFALDLLGETTLGPAITEKINHYDWGQSFFVIFAALDRPVPYRAGVAADQAAYVHAAGQTLDDLAVMFAQARAGLLPATPMVGIINEAGIDRSRAPDGKALMKFVMHFVPYRVTGDARGRISGTNWDVIKETRRHDRFHFRDLPTGLTRPHHRPLGAVSGRSGAPHQERGARHAPARRLSPLSDRVDAPHPGARLVPLADWQCLSVRRGQPPGVWRDHGARAQRGAYHLCRFRPFFSCISHPSPPPRESGNAVSPEPSA